MSEKKQFIDIIDSALEQLDQNKSKIDELSKFQNALKNKENFTIGNLILINSGRKSILETRCVRKKTNKKNNTPVDNKSLVELAKGKTAIEITVDLMKNLENAIEQAKKILYS